MPINRLPSMNELAELISFYLGSNTERTILVPVLVNYSPITLLSKRNYYLCIVFSSGEVSLGYSTEMTTRGLVPSRLPYSSLPDLVSQAHLFNIAQSDVVRARNSYTIENIELITSIGVQSVGALSIVTSEYEYLKTLIQSTATQASVLDEILNYAIRTQSYLDAFLRQFTGRRGDDSLPKYAEIKFLNHMLSTNIDISGGNNLLNTFQQYRGAADTDVLMEQTPTCLSDEFVIKVIYPDFDVVTLVPNSYKRKGKYFITSLAYLYGDFGAGSISGVPAYKPTPNFYLMSLMCNDKAFRRLRSKPDTIYNWKYSVKENPVFGPIVESSNSNARTGLPFLTYLSGSIFSEGRAK